MSIVLGYLLLLWGYTAVPVDVGVVPASVPAVCRAEPASQYAVLPRTNAWWFVVCCAALLGKGAAMYAPPVALPKAVKTVVIAAAGVVSPCRKGQQFRLRDPPQFVFVA